MGWKAHPLCLPSSLGGLVQVLPIGESVPSHQALHARVIVPSSSGEHGSSSGSSLQWAAPASGSCTTLLPAQRVPLRPPLSQCAIVSLIHCCGVHVLGGRSPPGQPPLTPTHSRSSVCLDTTWQLIMYAS